MRCRPGEPADLKSGTKGEAIGALLDRLAGDAHLELREAFLSWLTLVRLPSQKIMLPLDKVHSLSEVQDMLRDDIQHRIEQGRAKGVEQGIKQGVEQGIEQGIEQGALKTARGYVVKILTRRFGHEPMWTRRIASIHDLDLLNQLLDVALDAKTAQEVLHDLDRDAPLH